MARSTERKSPWTICPACEGEGTTVNPSIDAHGLTSEDFAEDPDFAEDYRGGRYDQRCAACNGTGKLRESEVEELHDAADDRAYAALEDGDYESYRGARDLRFGR